jgi:hypothetical protein
LIPNDNVPVVLAMCKKIDVKAMKKNYADIVNFYFILLEFLHPTYEPSYHK